MPYDRQVVSGKPEVHIKKISQNIFIQMNPDDSMHEHTFSSDHPVR